MLDNINLLKEKLDLLLKSNASYDEIYAISKKIDELLVDYYKSQDDIKELVLRK
ncbi:MAG: Spo0E family sporulation regulatory protein-aspartic acid phosphatase [Clostridia bacterium]|nr:Spo0E family sporulation regulatory protein-aspartic acid phosphatase [Clostridia bacterium]